MPQRNKAKWNTILADLLERNSDIKSAVIATSDGIAVTGVNTDDKSNRLAAMAAASLGLGKQVITTVCGGNMEEVRVVGDQGQIFIYSISSKAVLVIVTKELPNVALVNWEAGKTLAQLSQQ